MTAGLTGRRRGAAMSALAVLSVAASVVAMAAAHADNRRLNNSVVENVYTLQSRAGCGTTIKVNPKLRLAAEWQANDVVNNHDLDGDIGSDGTTVTDRARNAGYAGAVAETTAINPALAISGVEILQNWFGRPDYLATMQDCSNIDIGVWSVNSIDRSVVVAVYGKGDTAEPVTAPPVRQFGQIPGWTP
jgi:hypothetical protein